MSEPRHLSGLDGLRGIAALIVLMLHITLYFKIPTVSGLFKNHAYLAVDCFYMLSGFIIAHSFDRKMESGLTFSGFYLMRVLRLYPMLLVGAALGGIGLVGFWCMNQAIPISSIVTAALAGLFLVPTHALVQYKPYVFPLNSSYWSLCFEFLLYAFYAISYRQLKRPALLALALGVSAAALISISIAAGGLDVGYRASDYLFGFGRALFPFLVGIAIRRSRLYRPNSLRFGSVAAAIAFPLFCNPLAKSGLHDVIAVVLLLPVMIVCLANAGPIDPLDRFSRSIGDLSYPVYAIHYPIVVALSSACKLLHPSTIIDNFTALFCLFGIVATAKVLSQCYDRPMRTAMTRWLIAT